jgi:hypothetical protein
LKKMLKLGIALLVTTSAVGAGTAWGANVSVKGGSLNFASSTDKDALTEGSEVASLASGIQFGETSVIDVGSATVIPPIAASDYIRIDDNRGKNAGWRIRVSATDLSFTVDDPTVDNNTDTITVTVPVGSVLTAGGSNLTALGSSKTKGVTLDPVSALSTSGISLVSAEKGKGAGAYTADVTYSLSLPNFLPTGTTITATNADSPMKAYTDADIQDLGIFAGTYTTTVNYQISQAP